MFTKGLEALKVVSPAQFTPVPDKHMLVAEASDLGLEPGEWPQFLAVGIDSGPDGWQGNLYFYAYTVGDVESGQFSVTYTSQRDLPEVVIFNS